MIRICFACLLIGFAFTRSLAQETFQLAPPILSYRSVFFSEEAKVSMAFGFTGSVIRYTLDGRIPTENDPVYTVPLLLHDRISTLKARTFANGYIPSDPVQVTFLKEGYPIQEIITDPVPHSRYRGSGDNTLTDGVGGITSSGFSTWWGFDADSVEIKITLRSASVINKLLVNVLQQQGSWIFLPQKIVASVYDDKTHQRTVIAERILDAVDKEKNAECVPILLTTDRPISASKVFLTFHVVKNLPDWHSGKGGHGWMFIDEIEIF
jgi:hypothetical protein